MPAEVEKALKAKPSRPTAVYWPARMNYGDVLLQLGDATRAVRKQEKFLKQVPQNIFAIRSLSRAYISLSKLGEALSLESLMIFTEN